MVLLKCDVLNLIINALLYLLGLEFILTTFFKKCPEIVYILN